MTGHLTFFIFTVAAGFATLVSFAALFHRRPVHELPVVARVIFVIVFLAISIVAGRAWHETSHSAPAENTPEERRASRIAKESPASTATNDVLAPSTPKIASPQLHPRNASAMARHDEIEVADKDRALPDVVAAADDALNALRSHVYTVRGRVRGTQNQPDERLQGLITTDLTLDVTLIDSQGAIRDAFTITSRGGGFTRDSSALQARERLRDALQQHLQKEHS